LGTKESKNYHNREIKPKRWEEIRENLKFMGKYGNNNTNELQ